MSHLEHRSVNRIERDTLFTVLEPNRDRCYFLLPDNNEETIKCDLLILNYPRALQVSEREETTEQSRKRKAEEDKQNS